jgi:putative FmdB family regulatory protein
MPIYEYRCAACGHRFSHLFRSIRTTDEAEPPACPVCESTEVRRLISSVAVHLGDSSASQEEAPSPGESREVFGERELKRALDERGY